MTLATLQFSCATTFKGKVYQSMAIAAATGALYGASQSTNRPANALLFAATGAAIGGLFEVYMNDPEEEALRLRREAKLLRSQLDEATQPQTVHQSTAMFNSKVPDKYRNLINPGEWRVSKIDRWVEGESGESSIIHQDQIMELIPPTLLPK